MSGTIAKRILATFFSLSVLMLVGCLDDDSVPPPSPIGQVGGFVTAEPSDEYQSRHGGG
jgi:hypothetical protein